MDYILMVSYCFNNQHVVRILDNCRVPGLNSDAAFVGATSDEHVSLLSPIRSPLVTDDPVRSGAADSVANNHHLVIETVVIFLTS